MVFFYVDPVLDHCLSGHNEILLVKKSRSRQETVLATGHSRFAAAYWNIANLPFALYQTFAGDMTAICCLLYGSDFQDVSLCGLIQTNSRYFELFQATGGLDA